MTTVTTEHLLNDGFPTSSDLGGPEEAAYVEYHARVDGVDCWISVADRTGTVILAGPLAERTDAYEVGAELEIKMRQKLDEMIDQTGSENRDWMKGHMRDYLHRDGQY